jgi:hypothetical protein
MFHNKHLIMRHSQQFADPDPDLSGEIQTWIRVLNNIAKYSTFLLISIVILNKYSRNTCTICLLLVYNCS